LQNKTGDPATSKEPVERKLRASSRPVLLSDEAFLEKKRENLLLSLLINSAKSSMFLASLTFDMASGRFCLFEVDGHEHLQRITRLSPYGDFSL